MTRTVLAAAAATLLVTTGVEAQGTRDVTYHDRAVVSVSTRLRFTTLIMLPASEQILDVVCGDKDFWVVSGVQNLAYVKPAKAGARTNLNLVTTSGRVYSFLLTESDAEPDLKLYIQPDDTMAVARGDAPRFYAASEVEDLRRAAETARTEAAATAQQAVARADASIQTFRATYPTTLAFPYVLKGDRKRFRVSAIFHDDRFTYIHAQAPELPSLYELVDGTPNLVSFQVERGVYVVPKILDQGYLVLGDKRLTFARAE